MNCPADDQLSAYLDDMLPPAARHQVATHLSTCARCSQRLKQFELLQQDLSRLPSPRLGFDLAARLQPQFGQRRSRPTPVRRFWQSWAAPGLAATLSITAGIWLGALLPASMAPIAAPAVLRVFDPVPPGGLCSAAELCSRAHASTFRGPR